jgi:uncharacterized alpha-E superfamily protein
MKTILAILLCSVLGYGETLLDAPAANPGAKSSGFLASKTNRALIASDMMARLNDAISTVRLREYRGCDEAELPKALAYSKPGMMAFSVGLDLVAARVWRHGKLGRVLARGILLSDIVMDGKAGIHNEILEQKAGRRTTSR